MRTKNLLKLAFTMVAMLTITGAMAQSYPANIATNYVSAGEATYQTTGYGLRLYVAPDPAYSPDYDGSDPADINGASYFVWSFDNYTSTEKDAQENYIDIASGDLNGTAGSSITVYVLERIGAAAGCEGSIRTQTVTTVGAPTADIAPTGGGVWTDMGDGLSFTTCTDASTDDIIVTFTETGAPGGYANYTYGLTLNVTTYNADGTVAAGPTATTPVTPNLSALAVSPITYTPTMSLVGGLRTKYEYTLTASTIGSQISRISQYRANSAAAYSYYTGAATTITYWVNLPPVTGPIYHIPNNFSGF